MNSTIVFIVVAAGLCSAASSSAQTTVVPWIGGTARFGTYAMEDVNEDIRAVDALVAAKFDEINSGFGFGADLGLTLQSGVDLAIHYERFLAASDVSDASGSLEYDFAANAFYGTVEWKQRSLSGPAFGLGAGGGIVSSAGSASLSIVGLGSVNGDIEGSGPLFQAYALVDLTPRSRVSVLALAGYRFAKASSVEIDGEPLEALDGSDYDVDYSGLIVAASIRIRFSSTPTS